AGIADAARRAGNNGAAAAKVDLIHAILMTLLRLRRIPESETPLDPGEEPGKQQTEQREHDEPGIGFLHQEGPLRTEDRIAEPAAAGDHLGRDDEDQAETEADAHAGEDIRRGRGQ